MWRALLTGAGVIASLVWLAAPTGQAGWRLPATIETLQDIAMRPAEPPVQTRGVLYVNGGKAFTIRKGRRFRMVKIAAEGECRIEFQKRTYDVSSCPWLDGFADHQPDFFKIVPGHLADETRHAP